MSKQNTWNKKVKVNNHLVPKKSVLDHYKKQWKKKSFRDLVKKEGVFVRCSFGDKEVIKRKNIRIKKWSDMENLIRNHAVEFHVPSKHLKGSYVDVDIPKNKIKSKQGIINKILSLLKKDKITINMVTSSPNGAHIFTSSSKKKIKPVLKNIEMNNATEFHMGKTSKKKVVLDPGEPNVAVPGSLSISGPPYVKRKT